MAEEEVKIINSEKKPKRFRAQGTMVFYIYEVKNLYVDLKQVPIKDINLKLQLISKSGRLSMPQKAAVKPVKESKNKTLLIHAGIVRRLYGQEEYARITFFQKKFPSNKPIAEVEFDLKSLALSDLEPQWHEVQDAKTKSIEFKGDSYCQMKMAVQFIPPLKITCAKATELTRNICSFGTPNAFVEITTGKQVLRTKPTKGSDDIWKWGESFDVNVDGRVLLKRDSAKHFRPTRLATTIEVREKGLMSSAAIGMRMLTWKRLREIATDGEAWIKLHRFGNPNAFAGKILIKVKDYFPQTTAEYIHEEHRGSVDSLRKSNSLRSSGSRARRKSKQRKKKYEQHSLPVSSSKDNVELTTPSSPASSSRSAKAAKKQKKALEKQGLIRQPSAARRRSGSLTRKSTL